ncbi:MAG: DivIVA domain-containing protein [Acidimicrobiia bacterium]
MPLTPIDVQQKTFGTALRGYDLDEVDDFLDDIVTSLKDYEQRLRDAQERIATLEMEMTDRGDAEGAIARALVAAQRSADSILADAKVEAERIVEGARAEASEMSKARDDEKAIAEAEISRIRGIVDSLRSRLAELSLAVGVGIEEADGAIAGAVGDLEGSASVDVSLPDFEEPQPTWEQPSALDEIEELADADDEDDSYEESVDDSYDDSADDGEDFDDDDDEEDDVAVGGAVMPDWATGTDDDTPVRPWEVG